MWTWSRESDLDVVEDRLVLETDLPLEPPPALHRPGGSRGQAAGAPIPGQAGGTGVGGNPISPARLRASLEEVVVWEIRPRDPFLDVPLAWEFPEPLRHLAVGHALSHVGL